LLYLSDVEDSLRIASTIPSTQVIMLGYQLPPVSSIPNLTTVERITVLDALFEPCTALHTLSLDLLRSEAFESYNDLITSIGSQLTGLLESVSSSDKEWLDMILVAHPRLGGNNVQSEQSRGEQAKLNTGGKEEAGKLRELNAEYERAFPSLRYV
jgi:2-oxo-4-hydroxy-4-carboxy--5-ureidoimidazoline (OHCU) decarboxylase